MNALTIYDWLFDPGASMWMFAVTMASVLSGGVYRGFLKARLDTDGAGRGQSQLKRKLVRIENWSLGLRATYRLGLSVLLVAVAGCTVALAEDQFSLAEVSIVYSALFAACVLAVGSVLWGRNERAAFAAIGAHSDRVRPAGLDIYGQVTALRSYEGRSDAPALYPLLYESTVSRLANLPLEKESPWRWATFARFAVNVFSLVIFVSVIGFYLAVHLQDTAQMMTASGAVNEGLPFDSVTEEQLASNDQESATERLNRAGDGEQSDGSGKKESGQGGQGAGEQKSESEGPNSKNDGQGSPKDAGQADREKGEGKSSDTAPERPPVESTGSEERAGASSAERSETEGREGSTEKTVEQDSDKAPDVPPEELEEQSRSAQKDEASEPDTAPQKKPDDQREAADKHSHDSPDPKDCPRCSNPEKSGDGQSGSQQQAGDSNESGAERREAAAPADPNRAPDVPPEDLKERELPTQRGGEQTAGSEDSSQPKVPQQRDEESERVAQPKERPDRVTKDQPTPTDRDPRRAGDGPAAKSADAESSEFEDFELKRTPRDAAADPDKAPPADNLPVNVANNARHNQRTELKPNRYVQPLPISPQRVPPEYRTAFKKLFQRDE